MDTPIEAPLVQIFTYELFGAITMQTVDHLCGKVGMIVVDLSQQSLHRLGGFILRT